MAAFLAGIGIGLTLSTLGAGGSLLTVPVLVYLFGVDAHAAATASLAIVGTTALAGALSRGRTGGVRWRDGLVFGSIGVAGAVAGARAASLLRDETFLLLFAALVLVAAVAMLRKPHAPESAPRPSIPRIVAAALATGVLTGFFGVGGGFVVVPALVFALGLPMKEAIGTSLAVIAVNAGAGLLVRAGTFEIATATTLPFAIGGMAGAIAGGRIGARLPERALRVSFATALLALGAWIGVTNLLLLLGRTGTPA